MGVGGFGRYFGAPLQVCPPIPKYLPPPLAAHTQICPSFKKAFHSTLRAPFVISGQVAKTYLLNVYMKNNRKKHWHYPLFFLNVHMIC